MRKETQLALAVAIVAGCFSIHHSALAAGASPVVPSASAGAGTRAAPTSAPNSGMIPNVNSGMMPNTGAGAPTNPTAMPSPAVNPANNPANSANQNNPANPNNSQNAVTPNSNVANPAVISNGGAANWPAEQRYWRRHFSSQPYATSNATFTEYEPAYQYGVNLFNQTGGRQSFDRLNSTQLMQGWLQQSGGSPLSWAQAESAARDAYDRLYNSQKNGSAVPAATP